MESAVGTSCGLSLSSSTFRSLGPTRRASGIRVVYFNPTETKLWLLIIYTKAKFDNLPTAFLAQLRQEIEDAN
jgi:hypothetical protein